MYPFTYRPIKLILKSTIPATSATAGATIISRQSCASGHFDMMCISSGTLAVAAAAAAAARLERSALWSHLKWVMSVRVVRTRQRAMNAATKLQRADIAGFFVFAGGGGEGGSGGS